LAGLVVFLFQLIAVILAFVLRNNIETDFNKVGRIARGTTKEYSEVLEGKRTCRLHRN
jgi:hypothetical protein